MNREFLKKIFYQSLTGFLSLALAILLFFAIQKMDQIAGGFQWLMGVLTPFIYGGTLAYLLKTPCNFLEPHIESALPKKIKKWANALSVVIVLVLSVLVIYLLLSLVIPEVGNSIVGLAKAIPPKVEQFAQWALDQLEGNEVLQNYADVALSSLEDWLRSWTTDKILPAVGELMGGTILPTVGEMMGGAVTAVTSVATVLKNIILGIIICIYLLLDRKRLARHGKALLYSVFKPERADRVIREFSFIDRTFVGFFGGKILDSAIVGLICYVFCAIMSTVMAGFENAVLISLIIGVTNIIPYFGPFIGAAPSALLILISSPRSCIIFLIFILILQQFDGNVLGPKLLAGSVGLTGFWVLFSITLFQGMFGFVGILIGVPVFAVIYDLMKRGILLGLKKHGKTDVLLDGPPEETSHPTEETNHPT